MNNTIATYVWTATNGKIHTKRVKSPKILLTVRDSNNKVIVKVYRPKSIFDLLYHRINKWLKRKVKH